MNSVSTATCIIELGDILIVNIHIVVAIELVDSASIMKGVNVAMCIQCFAGQLSSR